ncbi:hypothetical protein AgCh_030617 [Apium graveolens]
MTKTFPYVIHTDAMKKKTTTKRRSNIYKEEEIVAALQLIQLRYSRKNDIVASCPAPSKTAHAFDLVDNDDEDGGEAEAVVGSVRKIKKFRSIVDLYNVTKPL